MEKEYRRLSSSLRILGFGVIAFTVWSVVKFFLVLLLLPTDPIESSGSTEASTIDFLILLLFFLVPVLWVVANIRIGKAAVAEASGVTKGNGYVVMGALFFALQTFGLLASSIQLSIAQELNDSVLNIAASFLVDFTSAFMLGDMVLTARKVKKLKRAAQEVL